MKAIAPRFTERQLVWGLVLLALVLRIGFSLAYGLDAPAITWGDDHEYDTFARRLAFDGVYENLWFPPGYPLFLAAVYEVFGANLAIVRLLQALIGALTCYLLYRIGRRALGARVGLLAGLVMAFYPGHLYMSWRLMSETLYIFLIAACVAVGWELFVPADDAKSAWSPSAVRSALFLGLLLGLANAVKSNLIILPPVLILALAVLTWRRPRRSFKPLVALAVAFALSTAITPVANLVASGGRMAFLPGNAGHTLWWSNNPEANGYFVSPKNSEETRRFIERHQKTAALEAADRLEKDAIYRDLAVHWVLEHPLRFLRLCGLKLANAYGPFPHAVVFEGNPKAKWVHLLSFGLIMPLALAGLFLARRRWRQLLLVDLVLATHLVMVLIFYGTPRFTIIVVPYLVLYASFSLVRFGETWFGVAESYDVASSKGRMSSEVKA